MARLLAIDWDRLEARIVVGRPQAGGVGIEKAITVPIDLPAQENSIEGLQEQLTKALSGVGVSKAQVLSAIGRSSVELRTMSLPPAPDEELPDMVRFQAMREFSSLKESSPLDFVPLRGAGQEDGEVIAAAVPVELSDQVRGAIVEQGHEPLRCVMRPASAASLALRRNPQARSGVSLVIAQQADSAELAVTNQGTVVFTRSFRLPPNWKPGETGEPLLGEVRRTIAAAQNQLGGTKVDRIILFGKSATHSALEERLGQRTKLPTEVIDPFDDLVVGGALPENPERFAALIGMLEDEAHEVSPALDFQNPRQRPEPESNRRQVVLYGMTAATILLGLLFLWWWKHDSLNKDIANAQWQITQAEDQYRKMRYAVDLHKELKVWKQADKNWLEEILYLSNTDGLSAEDFRIESLNAKTGPNGVGVILLRGRAKNDEALQKFQNKMQDDKHDVVPQMVTLDERQDSRYPLLFSTEIRTEKFIDLMAGAARPAANADPANPPNEEPKPEQPASNEDTQPEDA